MSNRKSRAVLNETPTNEQTQSRPVSAIQKKLREKISIMHGYQSKNENLHSMVLSLNDYDEDQDLFINPRLDKLFSLVTKENPHLKQRKSFNSVSTNKSTHALNSFNNLNFDPTKFVIGNDNSVVSFVKSLSLSNRPLSVKILRYEAEDQIKHDRETIQVLNDSS